MKIKFLIAGVLFLALTACKNKTVVDKATSADQLTSSEDRYACPMHPEITGRNLEKCSQCGMILSMVDTVSETIDQTETATEEKTQDTLMNEVVQQYLVLKNALVDDRSDKAAAAAMVLEETFKRFDKSTLTSGQKKVFELMMEDAVLHAKQIGAAGGNIASQREHFDKFSIDVYDLVKALGAGQNLYQDYCPKYNNGKGAIWLSETKEIRNPYYGQKMLHCGAVKIEIKS